MSPHSLPPLNQELLKTAWQRQLAYDKNASRYQRRFVFLRTTLAVLSVVVVVLAVLEGVNLSDRVNLVIDRTLLILPITITALLAFSVRFDRGQNWILLRGNAEALKMEIYYYRTGVGDYHQNRDAVLSKRIKYLSQGMKGSPVHQAAMAPYEEDLLPHWQLGLVLRLGRWLVAGAIALANFLWQLLFQCDAQPTKPYQADDGYIDLTIPDNYLQYRLESQFDWYRQKAQRLARQLQVLQAWIYFFGGVSTLLAASPYKSWVAASTAVVGGLANYLEFKRVEVSLVGYNQAADTLYDIRAWWYSLAAEEQEDPDNFSKLVTSCEETIHSENASWLQDMQDRLAKLYGTGDEEEEDTQEQKPDNSAPEKTPLP